MGFGFELYGKKSWEENRNLLKKERVYDKLKGRKDHKKTIYSFKSSNPELLKSIREKLQEEDRARRQKLTFLLIVLATVLASATFIVLFY